MTWAQGTDERKMLQLTQDVPLIIEGSEVGTLKKGLLFFVPNETNDNETIDIEFSNQVVSIHSDFVQEYSGDENVTYYERSGEDTVSMIKLSSDSEFTSSLNNDETEKTPVVQLTQDIDVEVQSEDTGVSSLLLGNRKVYLQKSNEEEDHNVVITETEESIKENSVDSIDEGEFEESSSDSTGLKDSSKTLESDLQEGSEVEPSDDAQMTQDKGTPNKSFALNSTTKASISTKDASDENPKLAETTSLKVQSISEPQFQSNSKFLKVKDVDVPIYDNRSGSLVKVGNLVSNQIYPITGVYGNWIGVKFSDFEGYVHYSGVTPVTTHDLKNLTSDTQGSLYVTITTPTPVYDNTSGKLVKFASIQGDLRYPVKGLYGSWYQVNIAGREGYIHKDNVIDATTSRVNYFKVTSENVVMYKKVNGDLLPYGEVLQNAVLKIETDLGNWYEVENNGSYGYIWKGATTPSVKSPSVNTSTVSSRQQVKTFDDVPVYDNSTGTLVQFGTVTKGQTVNIVNEAGDWWAVDFGGRIGYIYKYNVDPILTNGYFKPISNATVYDNSSGSLVKVGEAIGNQSYKISRDTGRWLEIRFGKSVGYVKKSHTQHAYTLNGHYNVENTIGNKSFDTKGSTIIYDNSTGSLTPLGRIEEGVRYPFIELAGNWFKVDIGGRFGFVYKDSVSFGKIINYRNTTYDISLQEMVQAQSDANPPGQTDAYTGQIAYISANKEYISTNTNENFPRTGTIITPVLNVRDKPTTLNSHKYGQLAEGEKVQLIGMENGWYKIKLNFSQFYNATKDDIERYSDPNSVNRDNDEVLQFLVLSLSTNLKESDLNTMLKGKGVLENHASKFIQASQKLSVNEVYLVSHALLETGNGTSDLAKGVLVKTIHEDRVVTDEYGNKKTITVEVDVPDKVVYNMYGYGAYDKCATTCGAEFAYTHDWFTPEAAIMGGAELISRDYINNPNYDQDTLYKIRWNPAGIEQKGYASHQYASDIGWAYKQTDKMYQLYQMIDNYTQTFDIPVFSVYK